MKLHEFYRKYANVPLSKRDKVLDRRRFGDMTLNDFFIKIQEADEVIRPWQIKLDRYLKDVEIYL